MDRIISYEGNQYGVRDVHNLLLPLLEKLDEHCRRYNINYSLAYGSLLGCVRNHGFIPWDDDVDIVMIHSEFERFIDTFKKKETVLTETCDVVCSRFLHKLQLINHEGLTIYVDLFIADNVPDNYYAERIKYYLVLLIKQIIIGRVKTLKKKTFLMHVRTVLSYLITFPISLNTLRRWYFKISAWGNSMETNRISSYSTTIAGYGRYHHSGMLDKIQYQKFEDIQLPIMEDYDTYLTKEYGKNYMIPPEEDKRRPSHLPILNRKRK